MVCPSSIRDDSSEHFSTAIHAACDPRLSDWYTKIGSWLPLGSLLARRSIVTCHKARVNGNIRAIITTWQTLL